MIFTRTRYWFFNSRNLLPRIYLSSIWKSYLISSLETAFPANLRTSELNESYQPLSCLRVVKHLGKRSHPQIPSVSHHLESLVAKFTPFLIPRVQLPIRRQCCSAILSFKTSIRPLDAQNQYPTRNDILVRCLSRRDLLRNWAAEEAVLGRSEIHLVDFGIDAII